MNYGWKYLLTSVKVPIIIFLALFAVLIIPFKLQWTTENKIIGTTQEDSYYVWSIDDQRYEIPKFAITVNLNEPFSVTTQDNRKIIARISVTYRYIADKLPTIIKSFDDLKTEVPLKLREIIIAQMNTYCIANYTEYEVKQNRASYLLDPGRYNSATSPFGIEITGLAFLGEVKYSE